MRAACSLSALVFAGALGLCGAAQAEPAVPSPSASAAALARKERAEERFGRAEQALAEGRFREALAGYREAIAIDPSARCAPVAAARAADLEAHAEGEFGPLAKLEATRRDPQKSGDRTAITALEQEIPSFPDGRVRSEAALLVAEAWWHRLGEPRRAIAPLTFAVEDRAADRLTRALALTELVAVRRELDELAEASDLVERYPDLSPGTRDRVRRLFRRTELRAISLVVLALLALIGIGSLVRVARRLGGVRDVPRAVVRPHAVAASLYLGGAAALLARLRGDGDPRPFLLLGLGVLAIDVIARTWRLASGDRRAAARAARAVTCAVGVVAVAFLAIERTDAGYLESFGL
jgi:tetratricopeptide (TPR) repeat protein